MDLIALLLVLIVVGVILHLVPMEPRIKTAAVAVVLFVVVMALLRSVGLWPTSLRF